MHSGKTQLATWAAAGVCKECGTAHMIADGWCGMVPTIHACPHQRHHAHCAACVHLPRTPRRTRTARMQKYEPPAHRHVVCVRAPRCARKVR